VLDRPPIALPAPIFRGADGGLDQAANARYAEHVAGTWIANVVVAGPMGAGETCTADQLAVVVDLWARHHPPEHATVLLLLGIPERTVMGLMGWSSTAMAARYQHIIEAIRRDVATSVGQLLWMLADQAAGDRPGLTGNQQAAIRLLISSLPEPWRQRLMDMFGDQGDGTSDPPAPAA
jgi:hypothetical protein